MAGHRKGRSPSRIRRRFRWVPAVLAVLLAGSLAAAAGLLLPRKAEGVREAEALLDRVPVAAFRRERVLAAGVRGPLASLNPLYASSEAELDLCGLVFEPLVTLDPEGGLLPGLAREWEVSPGGTSLSFFLEEGHTFPDGRPVEAADVVFTYQTLMDASYDGPHKGRFGALAAVEEVVADEAGEEANGSGAVGAGVVRFTFAVPEPEPDFSLFSFGILDRAFYRYDPGQAYRIRERLLEPVGSGDFRLDALSENGAELVLRNGRIHPVERVRLVLSDDAHLVRDLMAGDIDMARIPLDDRTEARIPAMPGFRFTPYEGNPDIYLFANRDAPESSPLSDPALRNGILAVAAGRSATVGRTWVGVAPLEILYPREMEEDQAFRIGALARDMKDRLVAAGIPCILADEGFPILANLAWYGGVYDLLLLPAALDNRLPPDAVVETSRSGPLPADTDGVLVALRRQAFVTSRRLSGLLVNPMGHPLSRIAGSWTDRLSFLRFLSPDGSVLPLSDLRDRPEASRAAPTPDPEASPTPDGEAVPDGPDDWEPRGDDP